MTKDMIKRFLSGIGVKAGEATRIKELRAINLRSNGNHVLDARTDEITFDNENSVIKIKEYSIKAANGILLHPELKGKTIEFFAPKKNIVCRFREPKVGDLIIAVDKTAGTWKNIGTVTGTHFDFVELDKEPEEIINEDILYADPTLFADAEQDLYNNDAFLVRTPITKFNADIYIDYAAIVSFSAVNRRQNY